MERSKLKLAIGNLGVSMGTNALATYMTPFLHYKTGSAALGGFMLSLGMLSGVIIQPLMGMISDATSTPCGRRKPYVLLFGMMCFAFALLLSAAKGIRDVLLWFFLFFMSFHAYQIPLNSMIPDNACKGERGIISGYWNLLGGIGAFSVPMLGGILWDSNNSLFFQIVGLTIALTSIIPVVSVKEKKQIRSKVSVELIKRYFKSDETLRFYGAKTLWWMAVASEMPYLVMYFNQHMAMGMDVSSLMVSVLMFFNIISSPFLGRLADRYDRKYLLIASLACFVLLNAFLQRITYLPLLVLTMAFIGICYASLSVFPFAILIDIMQKGHEGFYLGMDNVFLYLPSGISTAISGYMIAMYGYSIIFIIAAALALCAAAFIILFWRD
ncbi:MFS transporter [Caldanaerobius polysaccharolyticus]|uniref:MFS transporter n=1 Tax=Caldanaerobius polysaccharolyticus TaxID=44256 RepID=UPI0004797A10|nr:MFS transporter [Caldanaerobius polysaccharolyticus]